MRHMAIAFSLDMFSAQPPLIRIEALNRGLPVKALRDLVADPAVTLAAVARVVAPRRTLDRRLKEGGALTPEESDRLMRFVEVLNDTAHVFGGRAEAMEWLSTPKRAFDRAVPLDLMKSGTGARLIQDELLRLRHGFFA